MGRPQPPRRRPCGVTWRWGCLEGWGWHLGRHKRATGHLKTRRLETGRPGSRTRTRRAELGDAGHLGWFLGGAMSQKSSVHKRSQEYEHKNTHSWQSGFGRKSAVMDMMTSSNKKLLVTSASLLGTSALLVVGTNLKKPIFCRQLLHR